MSNRLQILRERAAVAELLAEVSVHNERIRTLRFRRDCTNGIEGEWDRQWADFFGGMTPNPHLLERRVSPVPHAYTVGPRWVSVRKRSNVCVGYLYLSAFKELARDWDTANSTLMHQMFGRIGTRNP